MARTSQTAWLAVTAAALALMGLTLAAWARWSASTVLESTRAQAAAAAERVGGLLSAAMAVTRTRAEGLAVLPVVRAAVETDLATVRDLARAEGLMLAPSPRETIELFQAAPRKRPLSLLRAPETSPTLAIARSNEVRIDEEAGALSVTVAVPVRPLEPRADVQGSVAVATRVDLSSVAQALAPTGLNAALDGAGEPVALSAQAPADGARVVVVPVPLGDVGARGTPPALTVRAELRAGGGAVLWSGRVLLVAAFISALMTFAANRRRAMPALPTLEEATTARRVTPREIVGRPHVVDHHAATRLNAPQAPLSIMRTAREKRSAADAGSDIGATTLRWNPNSPTPITQLRPARDSVPLLVDPRGDQLAGRYRLLQSLGRGHSADVYLAQSFVPGVPGTVALKLLSAPASPERAAFLATAKRQMRVTHGNVAQVLDVGEGEVAFVAMEYVEGCTLETLLRDLFARDEALPLPQTVAIMAALCRALDAARPLVHGAVKPSNVLVSRHNVVKLADFGAPPSPTDRDAPELLAGKAGDRRSDLYSAGVVLHELVTGRRRDGAAPSADGSRWPALPAPSSLRRGLPAALDAVVAKATRFSARARYAAAGELLTALVRATEDAVPPTSTAWLGDWVERARHSC